MKVSIIQIIYPGTNLTNFKRSFESILKQSFTDFEYLIVGEGGEDKLFNIDLSNPRVRFVNTSLLIQNRQFVQKEFSSASKVPRVIKKNLGAKLAIGEIIYFIDDDFILDPEVLSSGEAMIRSGSANMIAVHNSSDPSVSIWSKVRNFERGMYKGDTGNISCRFTTKEIFAKVGGFNESLVSAEDYDIHNRMLENGGVIGFIDPEEMHVGEPRTMWEILKKHYFYGQTMAEFINSKGNLSSQNASPIRSSYFKHWREFVKHPILAILFVYYQIARFTAGAIGGYKVIPTILKRIFFPKAKK